MSCFRNAIKGVACVQTSVPFRNAIKISCLQKVVYTYVSIVLSAVAVLASHCHDVKMAKVVVGVKKS